MSEQVRNEASPKSAEAGAGLAEVAARQDQSTNVSHTQLAQLQMTESSTPCTPPADSGKWSCEACTYENFPLSRKCTMCRAAKPLLGEDIFRLQDGASALPRDIDHYNNTAGAESLLLSLGERLRPLRIASPPAPSPTSEPIDAPLVAPSTPPCASPGASHKHKWSCETCTYENWPKALKCAMCGSPAPPAPPYPASNTPPPPVGVGGGGVAAAPVPPPALVPPPVRAPEPQPLAPHASRTRVPVGINELCSGGNTGTVAGAGASDQRRTKRRNADWVWLQACLGVVEGDARCVEAYLGTGGDPARALTAQEVALLNRASAFDAGHTLVHLAIRFQRQDILSRLLARISGGGPGLKRSPSFVAPDLAQAIRRHMASSVRRRRAHPLPATYLTDFCTFSLPSDIEELPPAVQEQLFSELLDREAQTSLERDALLNWSVELSERLGSRLLALWNRSLGDCLPDALAQAAYGVFDRSNTLRDALADTLRDAHRAFYDRWTAWERFQAQLLHYLPEEGQLRSEWARLTAAARRPGTPLHQLHVFALAHVLRRPLIVYGVDVVTSFRGEALGYARFQGIYLPLLWEADFCSKSPLCLGYTRGHFSALVPIEPYSQRHYICREQQEETEQCAFLPLTDAEGKLLPVHFLNCEEMGDPEGVVRRWLSVGVTAGGVLAAKQTLHARPLLVAQMLEEWLNHYRRLAQQTRGPFPPRLPAHAHAHAHAHAADLSMCSDQEPDTDDE